MTAKGAGADTPHGQGEIALQASGLGWTLLKPTFFAQNFATYSGDSIRRESAFYYPAGEGRTAFVECGTLLPLLPRFWRIRPRMRDEATN